MSTVMIILIMSPSLIHHQWLQTNDSLGAFDFKIVIVYNLQNEADVFITHFTRKEMNH